MSKLGFDLSKIINVFIMLIVLFAMMPQINASVSEIMDVIGAFGAIFGIIIYASLGMLIYGAFTLKEKITLTQLITLIIALSVMAPLTSLLLKYVHGYDADGDGLYNGTNDIAPLTTPNTAGGQIFTSLVDVVIGTGIGPALMLYYVLKKNTPLFDNFELFGRNED